jgi:hypothetical protein
MTTKETRVTATSISSSPVVIGGLGLIVLTGFFLARFAAPYGTTLLTIHKLAAVATIVFVVVRARQVHTTTGLGTVAWTVLVTGAVAFLAMIGTGGALSAMDDPPAAVATVHKIVPYVAVALTLTALWTVPVQRS